MATLEMYLNGLADPRGPRGSLHRLPSDTAWMLFAMSKGTFRLFLRSGYPDEGFHYAFFEGMTEIWSDVAEKGALLLPSRFASVPGRNLWAVLDRPGDPGYLLILEAPVDFVVPPDFLRLVLLSQTVQMAEDRATLPVWLDRMLPQCLRSGSPLLIVSEEGSGGERLVRFLLKHRFGDEYSRFHPGRLSSGVQLREFYGETTGERLRSSIVVPVMDRSQVIVVSEVADIAPSFQLRLFSDLAGNQTEKFWIFETSRDLSGMARAGQFDASLADLLVRNSILVPPLRKCKTEIPDEADRYLGELFGEYSRHVTLAPEARKVVQEYDWPGNLDEMHATIELAYLTSREGLIRPEDLKPGIWHRGDQDDLNLRRRTEEMEIRLILQAHALHGGNQVHMARALGISRGSLQYRLNKIGLEG